MRSRLGLPALLRRQILADRGVALVVVAVVTVVSGLVAAWPRVVEHIFTEDLHESVEREPTRTRDLTSVVDLEQPFQLMTDAELDAPGDVSAEQIYGEFGDTLEQARRDAAEPLRSSLGSAEYVLFGPRIEFGDHAAYWSEEIRDGDLTLTADPGYRARVDFVAGSAPGVDFEQVRPEQIYGDPVDASESGFADPSEDLRYFRAPSGRVVSVEPGETVRLLTLDIAMTSATAQDFNWEIGEVRELRPGVNARLSGIFEPIDTGDGYWDQHNSILTGHEFLDFNVGSTIIGQAFVDPVAMGYLTSFESFAAFGDFSLTMRIWFPFDVDEHRVGAAPELRDAMRAFLADPREIEAGPATEAARSASAEPPPTLRFASSSPGLLDQTLSAQDGAAALIAMVAAGPLGATIAVLALGLRMLIERRRAAFALVAARGAATRQLRVALAIEGLLLGLPAASAAAYGVHVLLPGEGGAAGWVLPAVVGIMPLLLLPLLVRPQGLAAQRRDLARFSGSWLRWTADALIVGAAGLALWLLSRRGLDAGAAGSGVDPLLAATPLLLALAACVLVLRLYPIPVALLARFWRSRRGLVPYVGAARAVRDPAGGLAAVLALVVGLTVGVLSTVLWATTQRGAEVAAEESVGADLRADGPAFTQAELDEVAAVPGVSAVTGVSSLGRISMTREDGLVETVDVYVADLSALADVQAGFEDHLEVPEEALNSGGSTVPLIASDEVGPVGMSARVNYIRNFEMQIVATESTVSGVTTGRRWVLIDRNVLNEVTGTSAAQTPRNLLAGVDGDAGELSERVAGVLPPQAQLQTRADAAEKATGGALGAGLRGAFIVAATVGGALAATAMIITMVIAAPSRGRLFSQLRTLGLSGRQARGLATWELAPLAITAVLSGSVLGLAIPWLLLPSVDLRALTGGSSQPGMSVEWPLVGGAVAGFVVVAVLAMSVAVASSRRLRLGTVLRVGEEV